MLLNGPDTLRSAPHMVGSGPYLIQFLGPTQFSPEKHLHWFSQFFMVHNRFQQNDTRMPRAFIHLSIPSEAAPSTS